MFVSVYLRYSAECNGVLDRNKRVTALQLFDGLQQTKVVGGYFS